MDKVIKLFKQIQDTSSLNDKKKIITSNKDNELFKKCMKFLLDGNIKTGISTKKIKKKVNQSSELAPYYLSVHSTFEDVMEYLQKSNTGKDEDIYEIQAFLSGHEENREFYEQMITKTFRLGADAKLVNKCIPGLIPTFDVMLGTPIDKVKLKDKEIIFITQKLNGTRCLYVDGKLMTRQGKIYTGLDHILSDINKFNDYSYSKIVLDGELVYKNKEGLSDSESFQKGTGIAMSKNPDKTDLKFKVFDAITLDDFRSGRSSETYGKRRNTYIKIVSDDFSDSENIEVLPLLYEGTDHSQIWKWLDYAEENDWEGIMLNLDTPYECKRTKNLIKVKKFFSCDIRCTGIEEGSGRNNGTLGALICDYKGNKVNVGTGFSDKDRKQIWQHPEDVIDKIITVKYKEETQNKDGGISIQFPVFEAVRFDKNEPSYN